MNDRMERSERNESIPVASGEAPLPNAPLTALPPVATKPAVGLTPDTIFRIMQRFDGYVGTTHARAPLVLTFNTFSVSAILIKWEELMQAFNGNVVAARVASILLVIIALAALVSLAYVFRVVTPYVSPRSKRLARMEPGRRPSLFYFEDVADLSVPELLKAMEERDDSIVRADLAEQAHALALSVREKFKNLNGATRTILLVQLPAIAALVLLKLVASPPASP